MAGSQFAAMLSLGLVLTAATATARPLNEPTAQAASKSFDEGLTAFDRGEHAAAAQAFEQSFALSGHPFAAYNAALAWRKVSGARSKEADALWLALSRPGLEPDHSKLAGARLSELRHELAFIEVSGPAGGRARFGGGRDKELPATFHLEPGPHRLRAFDMAGRELTRALDLEAGAVETLELPATFAPTRLPAEQSRPTEERSPLELVGWTGFGLGTALGAAAVGLGVATLDARDSFDEGGRVDESLHDHAVALRTATNVTAFSGAGLGLTGVVLLVTAALLDDEPPLAAGPNATIAIRF